MNSKRVAIIGALGLVLTVGSQGAERVKPTQVFMRQKLTYAQGVLEGITLEKYDLVATNASKLRDMSQTNSFVILRNPEYLGYKTNFQASVDALALAAKAQDNQKATEAYKKMTQSCVDCHKTFRRDQFVRAQLVTRSLENPNPPEINQP